MSKRKKEPSGPIIITHTMADGTVLEDFNNYHMRGEKIPYTVKEIPSSLPPLILRCVELGRKLLEEEERAKREQTISSDAMKDPA